MVTSRHEFLAEIHKIVKPATYLEVGVQLGTSLALAVNSVRAIGIDPEPLVTPNGNQSIYQMKADEYFENVAEEGLTVDMAFIDGSHLFEDALSDFNHIKMLSHAHTVIVFDDVLPYNQAIAERIQPPGDWTGDVWKVHEILSRYRGELELTLVDTFPTGTMMVRRMNQTPPIFKMEYDAIVKEYLKSDTVPPYILDRTYAVAPEVALAMLKEG